MSDIKLVSPMLDNFQMGDPISDHNGIRCCPAIRKDSDEKYIVKIISVPASQVQYDALLLTGICADRESALAYFNDLANGIVEEIQTLQKLSALEGFLPIENYQIVQMEDDVGYDIYILSKYKRTLSRQFKNQAMTHLGAINLGLDLCAALSVCRKLGYLYVDLKPGNVYMAGDQEYRIGDIGFVKLDSLKYASLPENYRSEYTAPEITDAYSALNTTLDIYALGLILFQAYNGGALPTPDSETGAMTPPAYADYEMSEIIMKACASNAEDRWQDPIEMGQALVAYMQRNGANDTPIIPCTPAEPEEEIPESIPETQDTVDIADHNEEAVASEVEAEDNLETISLLDENQDESAPCEEDADVAYDEVTEEVSDMLTAADELIAHPTPDPVVAPEPIDVPIPESVEPEEAVTEAVVIEEVEDVQPEAEDLTVDVQVDEAIEAAADEVTEEAAVEEIAVEDEPSCEVEESQTTAEEPISDDTAEVTAPKKKTAWWKGLLVGLLVAAICVAGYFYYSLYYLQPVSLILDGEDNRLTVTVDCAVEDLYVVCSDAYGNAYKEPVIDGQAEFSNLAPETAYTVSVDTDKFFKLTGTTSVSYRTPVQTKVIQFTALNGDVAGSVIISFAIDGNDSEQWRLYSSLKDQAIAEDPITFTGHAITLSDLEVGTTYEFRLEPVSDLFFDANNTIAFTPAVPIRAENLSVSGYAANSVTVSWNAPENAAVQKWIVRCYDGSSFSATVETTDLTATFEGIDPQTTYTIEVLAENMSVSSKITAAEGVPSLKNFKVTENNGLLTLTWNTSEDLGNTGWIVSYSISGTAAKELNVSSGNQCSEIPYIPNADYTFTVTPADGSAAINNQYSYKTGAATAFNQYGLRPEHIRFDLAKTPQSPVWSYRDWAKTEFTTTFASDSSASFWLSIPYEYDKPKDNITITYGIYDESGAYISSTTQTYIWGLMWDRGYSRLDIPSIPSDAGNYKIAVFFNGALVNETAFTITD